MNLKIIILNENERIQTKNAIQYMNLLILNCRKFTLIYIVIKYINVHLAMK